MKSSRGITEKKGIARAQAKEKIFQQLRADIISQKLKPGQAIREDELAQSYGISRTPIREMLRKLEQEDLVKVVPNKGAFVSELTQKDIEEVLEIRISLESAAARLAASKLTSEDLAQLKEIEKQLDSAVKLEDSILSFEADSRLHKLILRAAGNVRAHRIINNLMGQILRIRFISGHKPGRIFTTVSEQKQIVKALISMDPDRAEVAMRVHLTNAMKLLLPSSDMDKKFEEFVRNSFSL